MNKPIAILLLVLSMLMLGGDTAEKDEGVFYAIVRVAKERIIANPSSVETIELTDAVKTLTVGIRSESGVVIRNAAEVFRCVTLITNKAIESQEEIQP